MLNALPEIVVTATTLNTFKNQIDKFIGQKQYTVFPENSWVYIVRGIHKLSQFASPIGYSTVKGRSCLTIFLETLDDTTNS